jgi:hypothetical protein
MYNTSALRSLFTEPGASAKLYARMVDGQFWASNGHWLVALDVPQVPRAFVGYLPRTDQPEGYALLKGDGETSKAPTFKEVVPPIGDVRLEDTGWIGLKDGSGSLAPAAYRVLAGTDKRAVAVDDRYYRALLALCPGAPTITQGPGLDSATRWDVGPKFCALLMPLRMGQRPSRSLQGLTWMGDE